MWVWLMCEIYEDILHVESKWENQFKSEFILLFLQWQQCITFTHEPIEKTPNSWLIIVEKVGICVQHKSIPLIKSSCTPAHTITCFIMMCTTNRTHYCKFIRYQYEYINLILLRKSPSCYFIATKPISTRKAWERY